MLGPIGMLVHPIRAQVASNPIKPIILRVMASLAIDQVEARLAAIHRGIFSHRDSSLRGFGSSASNWPPEPAAALELPPVAGCKLGEQAERQQQAGIHKLVHNRN